jgi:hypothetical protein
MNPFLTPAERYARNFRLKQDQQSRLVAGQRDHIERQLAESTGSATEVNLYVGDPLQEQNAQLLDEAGWQVRLIAAGVSGYVYLLSPDPDHLKASLAWFRKGASK